MRKSFAIFLSAIALGLAMLYLSRYPPKASTFTSVRAQATALTTQATVTIRPIPAMGTAIQAMVMPIQAMAMAVLITARIGARVDAWLAEFIADGMFGKQRTANRKPRLGKGRPAEATDAYRQIVRERLN
jgi:uncharacterized membrane protein